MKKVLVIGGGGYVGVELAIKLSSSNYDVTVYDLFLYQNCLNDYKKIKIIKGDIRDLKYLDNALKNIDTVIHLACISNDPSFELNPDLGKSINLDCFEPFLNLCVKNKINHIIYGSSSSVYGVKKENNVSETLELEPLTDYSLFKAKCEKLLLNHNSPGILKTVIRPATVCGYSRRMRLDLVVNILSANAYFQQKIKVFGGPQLRPNIYIDDMINAYALILEADERKIENQIYNVGANNLSLNEIAKNVKEIINPDIQIENIKSNDLRSYHISSQKILDNLGYSPKVSIMDAIINLKKIFKSNILENPMENEYYYNIKRMKNINLK